MARPAITETTLVEKLYTHGELEVGTPVVFATGPDPEDPTTRVYGLVGRGFKNDEMPTLSDTTEAGKKLVSVTEIYATSIHGPSSTCKGDVHLRDIKELQLATLDPNVLVGICLGNF